MCSVWCTRANANRANASRHARDDDERNARMSAKLERICERMAFTVTSRMNLDANDVGRSIVASPRMRTTKSFDVSSTGGTISVDPTYSRRDAASRFASTRNVMDKSSSSDVQRVVVTDFPPISALCRHLLV